MSITRWVLRNVWVLKLPKMLSLSKTSNRETIWLSSKKSSVSASSRKYKTRIRRLSQRLFRELLWLQNKRINKLRMRNNLQTKMKQSILASTRRTTYQLSKRNQRATRRQSPRKQKRPAVQKDSTLASEMMAPWFISIRLGKATTLSWSDLSSRIASGGCKVTRPKWTRWTSCGPKSRIPLIWRLCSASFQIKDQGWQARTKQLKEGASLGSATYLQRIRVVRQ